MSFGAPQTTLSFFFPQSSVPLCSCHSHSPCPSAWVGLTFWWNKGISTAPPRLLSQGGSWGCHLSYPSRAISISASDSHPTSAHLSPVTNGGLKAKSSDVGVWKKEKKIPLFAGLTFIPSRTAFSLPLAQTISLLGEVLESRSLEELQTLSVIFHLRWLSLLKLTTAMIHFGNHLKHCY